MRARLLLADDHAMGLRVHEMRAGDVVDCSPQGDGDCGEDSRMRARRLLADDHAMGLRVHEMRAGLSLAGGRSTLRTAPGAGTEIIARFRG